MTFNTCHSIPLDHHMISHVFGDQFQQSIPTERYPRRTPIYCPKGAEGIQTCFALRRHVRFGRPTPCLALRRYPCSTSQKAAATYPSSSSPKAPGWKAPTASCSRQGGPRTSEPRQTEAMDPLENPPESNWDPVLDHGGVRP